MIRRLIFTEDGESASILTFEAFIAVNVDAMRLDAREAKAFETEVRGALNATGAYYGGGGAAGRTLLCKPEALDQHLPWVRDDG